MPHSSRQGRTLLPAVTPGTRTGRCQNHRACTAGAANLMRDGRPFQVHLEHHLAGILGGLFNSRRNFVRLAVSNADVSFAIASDNQRAEAERATTLDHLRTAVDLHHRRFHAAFIRLALTAITTLPTALATALSTATPLTTTALTTPLPAGYQPQ